MYGFGFSDLLTESVCKKLVNGSPYWRARRQRERTSVKHSWQVVSAVTINCKEHFVFKAFSAFTKEKTLLNKYRRGTPLILNSGGFFPFQFCLETNKSASWVLVSGVVHCLTNMGVNHERNAWIEDNNWMTFLSEKNHLQMQIRTLLCVNEKYDANYHFRLQNVGK